MNPTLDLIGARTSTRTFSAEPITAEEREAHPAGDAASADRRRDDAVLDHRGRGPGAQGPARRHLRRPAVHRSCAVGAGVPRRHAAVDGPVRRVGREVARGCRAPRYAGTRRPDDGLLGRAHRRADRRDCRRVARHRVVLHRRRARAGRDPRRAAGASQPHAARRDGGLRTSRCTAPAHAALHLAHHPHRPLRAADRRAARRAVGRARRDVRAAWPQARSRELPAGRLPAQVHTRVHGRDEPLGGVVAPAAGRRRSADSRGREGAFRDWRV